MLPAAARGRRAQETVWQLSTVGACLIVVAALTFWFGQGLAAFIAFIGVCLGATVSFVGALVIDALRPR